MIARLEELIFRHRLVTLAVFAAITLFLGWFAAKTRVDASFDKQLPTDHEYIENFRKHRTQFGGANRVVIALVAKQGNIFTPEFFQTLKAVTDEAYYLPGVDRAQVMSIFTPNVRYIEVVEEGLQGGNVIPADFAPDAAGFEKVRQNIVKSGRLGMLVANDYTGAAVIASLQEVDPQTGRALDYAKVATALEEKIRGRFQTDTISVHIIGFAKVIGDITDGAKGVLVFFGIALVISAVLLYYFSQSVMLTVLPLLTSFCAVVWQFGILNLLGFGIDPLSILVPFLIFAIALSHATQMLRSFRYEINMGKDEPAAARASFSNLFVPGCIAILTGTVGFSTIYLVHVPTIQELAITASLGVFLIIFTDRFLLPVLVSYTKMSPGFRRRVNFRRFALQPYWRRLTNFTTGPVSSVVIIVLSLALLVFGWLKSHEVKIGDLHAGVPELRQDSRYNQDTAVITHEFSIGVDVITVLAETVPNGVVDYDVMSLVDRFAWHMRNIEGVQSTAALTDYARTINAGWNEGALKWRVIPRNPAALAQSVSPVETATGFLNNDGSVIPVMIYLHDHKAETIKRVIAAVKEFRAAHTSDRVKFALATGNIGVMAATNEVVAAAQTPMVLWVYAAVIVLCLLSFRSWRGALCVIVPLVVVSYLGYALKYYLNIGLKTSTLPVIALGVGIGVDYGIYLFSAIQERLEQGETFEDALCFAFATMGTSVMFTGSALAVGVGTWAWSALKFQADMGILLSFLFFFNMLGAMLLMPALGRWLFYSHLSHHLRPADPIPPEYSNPPQA
ncbi:RND family transporter [Oleiharenicola lentus]|uniref:RND family transporter n=1 Tax=Oleiharenicola lentus TaxID=2508720 RepID=A0A4Q1CBX9_9BACT|nr:MMPL family transporter [Oleiharenicola lentus]RXK56500.1 RND family transporter [Oleiharenicola lentus]